MTRFNDSSSKIAKFLLEIKAVKLQPRQPFTWASGWKSPIYCDNRKILSYPNIRTEVIDGFVALVKEKFEGVEVIAGVATAGIAHGALLAEKLGLPFVYVRSKAKGHGLQNLIEGHLEPNKKVVVVEDLISTGKSTLAAVDALRQADAEIMGAVAIFTYGFDKAVQSFKENNCPFFTLTNYETLIGQAKDLSYVQESEISTLQDWRKAPEVWGN